MIFKSKTTLTNRVWSFVIADYSKMIVFDSDLKSTRISIKKRVMPLNKFSNIPMNQITELLIKCILTKFLV